MEMEHNQFFNLMSLLLFFSISLNANNHFSVFQLQVFTTTLALSLFISSINAEESKSSSNNDTITTLDVSSSNNSYSSNSTKNESDTREKRNLNGFGTNFYYNNNNNNNKKNYYSSVPKAVASSSSSAQQTAQRRSSGSSGGYPFNSNYDFNSLDYNNNKINQKKHPHNNQLTMPTGPYDFVKNHLSHYRAKHSIKNNQENGNF